MRTYLAVVCRYGPAVGPLLLHLTFTGPQPFLTLGFSQHFLFRLANFSGKQVINPFRRLIARKITRENQKKIIGMQSIICDWPVFRLDAVRKVSE